MKLTRTLKLFITAMLMNGCASYQSVENAAATATLAPLPDQFTERPEFISTDPVTLWWQELNDPLLADLINRALEVNHDLRIARASLDESRALLRHQKLDWLPTVEADLSASRQKLAADARTPGTPAISETYRAGFDASWELDLFGRTANAVKAAAAQLQEREANIKGMRVSVAAEVASAYISLRGAQHQWQVANNNADNLEKTYNLTQRLADVGRADELDTQRALTQLALVRATLPGFNADMTLAINRIGVLTHQTDSTLQDMLQQHQPLPAMPQTLAIGTPQTLLRRRPDIQRAELELQASVARYNVEVANLYPSITFNGGLGYLATDFSRLGETETESFVFGPSIHWAAFNLGRVYASIDAADARTRARLAAFEQQVLLALEETDNALESFSREEERRAQLIAAAVASQQALSFARQKYEVGAEDFLSVLDAERAELIVSAELAASETRVLQNLIRVYKTLGGGWEAGPALTDISYTIR